MKRKILLIISLILIITGCSSTEKKSDEAGTEKTTETVFRETSEYLKQYEGEISLDDAIDIARERNLELKIKDINSQIATLDRKIAFGNFLPSVGVYGSYTRLDDPINLEAESWGDIGYIDENSHKFSVQAQMPIFVPSLWYLYSSRKKGEDISRMIEKLVDKKIQLQVMGQYYYIRSLEESNKSLETALESAVELEKKGETALQVEAIALWEYKKLKLNTANRRFLLKQNIRNLRIAKMELMKSLDLNPLSEFKVKKDIKNTVIEISLEDAVFEALNQNDMLKIRGVNSDIEDDKVKMAITNFLPKVVLGGGYSSNSNSILSDPDFLYGSVGGMVSIFNGFKNVNQYKKAKKSKEISGLQIEEEFLRVVVETSNAYRKMEEAEDIMNLSKMNYDAEREKMKQSTAQKEVGIIDTSEYLADLSEYERSIAQLNQAEFNYEVSIGALKIAMGENPVKDREKDEDKGEDNE